MKCNFNHLSLFKNACFLGYAPNYARHSHLGQTHRLELNPSVPPSVGANGWDDECSVYSYDQLQERRAAIVCSLGKWPCYSALAATFLESGKKMNFDVAQNM